MIVSIPEQSVHSLYLLPPSELPTSLVNQSENFAEIDLVFTHLLTALNHDDSSISLKEIEIAIDLLAEISTNPAEISNTQTKLKYWEVEEYDQYFQVFHVHSPQPDRCLIHGLLTTCHRFFKMLQQCDFNLQRVAESRLGFISYVQLLQRLRSI